MLAHHCFARRAPTRRLFHDVCTAGRLGMPADAVDATLPRPLQSYLRALHDRPTAAATVTAGCTAAVGDGVARIAAWALDDAEVARGISRTVCFAGWSALAVGVGGSIWYRALRRKFPGDTYEVALRTILDLSVFSPVLFGATLGVVTWLETGSVERVGIKLRDDWLQYIGKLWVIWGGGSVLSYLNMPMPWQPPFALGISITWFSYLSFRVHRSVVSDELDQSHIVAEYLERSQKR